MRKEQVTNKVIGEPEGSKPLTQKPDIGHHPQPVPTNSTFTTHLPKIPSNVILQSPEVFQVDIL